MEDLRKVSSEQLFLMWKNLSIGLLTIIAMIAFSRILPFYLSPIVSLVCAAVLYTFLYNHRVMGATSCVVVIYAVFFCLIAYSFVTILVNILFAWGLIFVPREFIFFNNPYIPSLMACPVSFLSLLVIYLRRRKLHICMDCRLQGGDAYERGILGNILSHESQLQLKNLLILFGILTAVVWSYYFIFYININVNARDWYVFIWLVIIAFIFDEIYFIYRYYNLYLDLKEKDEIISPEELRDMTAKTYLRYYVICGNYLYVDTKVIDPGASYKQTIDTPFITKRNVNGITIPEVKRIIERMSGVTTGDLRFFYGRRLPDLDHHSLLRYFYFLDGDISEYQNINVDGMWMNFEDVKKVYSKNPGRLAPILVADITRLATIMLTEKIFDENGFRKSKIKQYRPTFNLVDVKNSDLDFQDDKWIQISLFNSDTPLYRIKKWFRRRFKKTDNSSSWG